MQPAWPIIGTHKHGCEDRQTSGRAEGEERSKLRLNWHDLNGAQAESADGAIVEIDGFPAAVLPSVHATHFMLTFEPGCCPLGKAHRQDSPSRCSASLC